MTKPPIPQLMSSANQQDRSDNFDLATWKACLCGPCSTGSQSLGNTIGCFAVDREFTYIFFCPEQNERVKIEQWCKIGLETSKVRMSLRNEHFQNAARGPLKYVGPGPSAPHFENVHFEKKRIEGGDPWEVICCQNDWCSLAILSRNFQEVSWQNHVSVQNTSRSVALGTKYEADLGIDIILWEKSWKCLLRIAVGGQAFWEKKSRNFFDGI